MSQSRTRTHALRAGKSGISSSLCGMVAVRGGEPVTCVLCLRELDRLASMGVGAADVGVVVVPDSERGTRFDPSLASVAEAEIPGRVERRYRWGTVPEALETWARYRVDGYSAKSLHGVTEALGRDGVRVDGGQPGTPKALRQAEDCAEVERCVRHVFGTLAWEGLLDADTALRATLWRWVASEFVDVRVRRHVRQEAVQLSPDAIAERLEMEDVTGRVVRRTTDRAMRLLRVEMVARGLVPPRREPDEKSPRRSSWERERDAVDMRRKALRGG